MMRPTRDLHAAPAGGVAGHLHFTRAQCDALYAAVLVNDRIETETALPDAIRLDQDQEQLVRCFAICRQVWETGVDRRALRRMVDGLWLRGALPAEDQIAFKDIRAKFKQIRFAFANFDARHRYPTILHAATATMGNLQDEFKNGRAGAVRARAALLRLFLSRAPFALMEREIDAFRPSTAAGFRDYVIAQMAWIGQVAEKAEVTGQEFHEIRKSISRQASFYVSLQTLYPSADNGMVFRYLSAINGLMGRLHDELVERRIKRIQDYHADAFAFPEEIRHRLRAIAERYPRP